MRELHVRLPETTHSTFDDPSLVDLEPEAVAAAMQAGEVFTLLDVREDAERRLAAIPGAVAAPLSRLGRAALPVVPGRPVVVVCHHGVRSAYVVRLLRGSGCALAFNLLGGIEAWARRVDPRVGRY